MPRLKCNLPCVLYIFAFVLETPQAFKTSLLIDCIETIDLSLKNCAKVPRPYSQSHPNDCSSSHTVFGVRVFGVRVFGARVFSTPITGSICSFREFALHSIFWRMYFALYSLSIAAVGVHRFISILELIWGLLWIERQKLIGWVKLMSGGFWDTARTQCTLVSMIGGALGSMIHSTPSKQLTYKLVYARWCLPNLHNNGALSWKL
jgi:hypothetical protein